MIYFFLIGLGVAGLLMSSLALFINYQLANFSELVDN